MIKKSHDPEAPSLVIKPGFLPLNQVRQVYGLSRSYLYQLKYQRKIFHYELGARVFIKTDELEALIASGRNDGLNKKQKPG